MEKRRIVAEALEPGANVSAVARRHGVAPPLLYRWRKEAVVAQRGATVSPGSAFLPVIIEGPTPADTADARPSSTPPPSLIEIVLSRGRVVRVSADVDTAALARIIAALEAVA